jgi:hypothetical protein
MDGRSDLARSYTLAGHGQSAAVRCHYQVRIVLNARVRTGRHQFGRFEVHRSIGM